MPKATEAGTSRLTLLQYSASQKIFLGLTRVCTASTPWLCLDGPWRQNSCSRDLTASGLEPLAYPQSLVAKLRHYSSSLPFSTCTTTPALCPFAELRPRAPQHKRYGISGQTAYVPALSASGRLNGRRVRAKCFTSREGHQDQNPQGHKQPTK